MKIKTLAIGASLGILAFSACSRTQTTQNFEEVIADNQTGAQNKTMDDDLNKSKTILYTLPAPVEMASIIQQAGVKFDDQFLANLGKAGKYNTNLKMALNLGIYGTDMSVAGMFSQSQRMVDYLNVMKDLTRKLGIVQVMDEDAINKLQNVNLSKKDALDVISDLYMSSNQYLKENNRENVATMVMCGGWIEGLYLALNLMDTQSMDKNITERIISQKLALTTMLNIIDSSDPDGQDEDINYIRTKMNEIKQIFDVVNIERVGRVSAITDMDTRTTTIKANTSGDIDANILAALKSQVNAVRAEFAE